MTNNQILDLKRKWDCERTVFQQCDVGLLALPDCEFRTEQFRKLHREMRWFGNAMDLLKLVETLTEENKRLRENVAYLSNL